MVLHFVTTVHDFAFCHEVYLSVSYDFQSKTVTISLNSVKELMFVMVVGCVFCEVGAVFIITIIIIFGLKGSITFPSFSFTPHSLFETFSL